MKHFCLFALIFIGFVLVLPAQRVAAVNNKCLPGTCSEKSDSGQLFVTDFGANGKDALDDTSAFQAAINAAVILGNTTINIPCGTFIINGPLQGTVRPSVLRIPQLNGDSAWASIEFKGCAPPAFPGFGSISLGTDNMSTQGTVILSTGNGGAVFGAEPGLVGGAAFNASRVIYRNMTIRTKDNPTRTAIDARYNLQLEVDNVMIDTGKYGSAITEPSTPGVTGIYCPNFFNATSIVIQKSCVSGYYDGYNFSELATGDDLIAYHCKRAWVMNSGALTHALHFGRLVDSACQIGIAVDAPTRVVIDEYDAEKAVAGWFTRLYDVDGSGATLLGSMNYHISTALTGAANSSLLLHGPSDVDYFAAKQIGARQLAVFDCSGTTQTLANGGYSFVQWQTQLDGPEVVSWSSANPEQITANNSGIYQITASVAFEANSLGYRQLFLYSSGAWNTMLAGSQVIAIPGEETVAQISATVFLRKGEFISIQAHQTSGSSLNVKNLGVQSFASKLMIAKIG